jgi:hypothetical protein
MSYPKKNFGQRQPSPVLLRQVYTNQGVPVTMGVITNAQKFVNNGGHGLNGTTIVNNNGQQYVLVQRASSSAPRASSAPPSQNQVNLI